MQCLLVDTLPRGAGWTYEIKWDGFRALAIIDGKRRELISRNKISLTEKYPELIESLAALPVKRCVLDGEIVAIGKDGRPSFNALQNASTLPKKNRPIFLYVFDILNYEGRDLTALPLIERQAILRGVFAKDIPGIFLSSSLVTDPDEMIAAVGRLGLEGVVGKLLNSRYEVGMRSGAWVKYKCLNEQEFIIGGYTDPKGSRPGFGALLIGYYGDDGELTYASKVGTGFTHAIMQDLMRRFESLRQKDCPFVNLPHRRKGRWGQGITAADMQRIHWLRPELVCQIAFTQWTEESSLRHPAFLGLREDKSARDVVREIA